MKKVEELRDLSIDQLKDELLDLRRKQFDLRMDKASGTLEKTHTITNIRRTIARVKTLMSEKMRYQNGS